MKIAITYNLKPAVPGTENPSPLPEDAFEEFDTPETLHAIQSIFESCGHRAILMEANGSLLRDLDREKPNFVFNLAEGYEGPNRESHVPHLLEWLGIPHSGSDGTTLAISLDKALAKIIARHHGVRTPEFSVLPPLKLRRASSNQYSVISTQFPLFIKPLREGSSKGIRLSSLVRNQNELENEIERLRKNYGQIPLIAEQFIPGREITVGVLGTREPRVIGMMEIRWKDAERKRGPFIYSLETKRNWRRWVQYEAPPQLSDAVRHELEMMAITIHQGLGCRDISRIDFRLDEKGIPYFLEINPLPGLSPDSSDLVIMMEKQGMTHRELVLAIFEQAMLRYPS